MVIGTSDGNIYEDEFDYHMDRPMGKLDTPTTDTKPSQENSLSKAASGFLTYIKGEEPPKTFKADISQYPTSEEVDKAKQAGFGYGSEWETYFSGELANVMGKETKFSTYSTKGKKTGDVERFTLLGATDVGRTVEDLIDKASGKIRDLNDPVNKEIKEKISDSFGKAAIASGRSAIASLGFSPSNTVADVVTQSLNIGGITSPTSLKMYSNYTLGKDSILHESAHRGLMLLAKNNPKVKEVLEEGFGGHNQYDTEEYIVRHLMDTRMGGFEEKAYAKVGIKSAQIDKARQLFGTKEGKEFIDKLEAAAAEQIAKRKPGGPR